jgi:hypothetical protein
VVHISDSNDGVDDLLTFLGLGNTASYMRTHADFVTPWFIKPPTSYGVETVRLDTLRIGCAATVGKCTKGGSVLVGDSPHFAFASGRDPSLYVRYYAAGRQAGSLTDDHTPRAFERLSAAFDLPQYPACVCGFDGVERRSIILVDQSSRIVDGARRAALLLADNPERTVEVVRLGVKGRPVRRCTTTPPTRTANKSLSVPLKQRFQSLDPTKRRTTMEANLVTITAALDAMNCLYHLDAGTLLGMVRDEQLILNDSDLDVAIYGCNSEARLLELLQRLPDFTLCRRTDNLWSICRDGTYTDLEHWVPNDNGLCYYGANWVVLPCIDVFPTQRRSFKAKSFVVPNVPEGVVEWENGVSWRTPSNVHTGKTADSLNDQMVDYVRNTLPTPSQIAVAWLQQIQMRTPTLIFKVGDAFPNEMAVGADVDVLVASIDAAVAAVREGGVGVSKLKSTVLASGTQVHLDYVQGRNIHVRLDLYEAFAFPDVSERKAPTTAEVFAAAIPVTTTSGWQYSRTSLEHECRLRWMEWAQLHKQRPEKKKHLEWIARHGCASRRERRLLTDTPDTPQPRAPCPATTPPRRTSNKEMS